MNRVGRIGSGMILFAAGLLFALQGCVKAPAVTRVDVRPGESLVSVRNRVRALSAEDRAKGVEVVFAPGSYILDGTLELDAADGGATAGSPVVWRAEKSGRVKLTSSWVIPANRFAKVVDDDVLRRLPPENRGNTLVADVGDLLPSGDLPEMEVFINGDFGTCARWPNAGEYTSFTGRVDVGTKNAQRYFERGAFVYSNPRAKRWDFSKGVKLYGYWSHDWASQTAVAYFYGAENGTNDVIRLSTPVSYGVNAGTWGRKERRFYAWDLLEELDAPNEWWLDRKNRKFYIVPDGKALDGGASICLAPKAPLAILAKDVSNLKFQGFAFEGHNGPAVKCVGVRDLTICDCSFAGIGGAPVMDIIGERCRISRCELRHIAGCGIRLRGGDRKRLVRARNLVEYCRVLDFGVRIRTSQGAMEVEGCGHVIRNNEFAYAPNHAMRYETNETIIENNDVHHVLLETGDAGAIYTGCDCTTQGNIVRYNFIHELGSEGVDDSTMGLYFDDCDCGDAVYGNVFWKCARGILLGGGRNHPIVGNVFAECSIGLSIDHRGKTWKQFYQQRRSDGHGYQPDRMAEMKVTEEPWRSRYPQLARQMEDSPQDPLYNPVVSNVFIDCQSSLVLLEGKTIDPVLPKMVFSDNRVLVTKGVRKWARPDARIADAFTIQTNVTSTGFVDPFRGDFRACIPSNKAEVKLPYLGPRWGVK